MTKEQGLTAQLVRFDARRSKGTLKCQPPNRKCGNRCIPPNWNCRLKGEGEDPHLTAVGKGSDPISGLANIERGVGRILKSVPKLSIAEFEGGRRSIARGAAKLSPGDMQKKKEIQDKVNGWFVAIGAPVAVAFLAGATHTGLKSFRGYRKGVGAQIDNAVGSAIRTVSRNTPVIGNQIRAREAAGRRGVASGIDIYSRMQGYHLNRVGTNAGTGNRLQRTASITSDTATRAINAQLDTVDLINGIPNRDLSLDRWETLSRRAFWTTPRPPGQGPDWLPTRQGSSVFSVPATNALLSYSFAIKDAAVKRNPSNIVKEMATQLSDMGNYIRVGMKEAGLNSNSSLEVASYIRANRTRLPGDALEADKAVEMLVEATTNRTGHAKQAQRIYSDVVAGYDTFFAKLDINELGIGADIRYPSEFRTVPERRAYLNDLKQRSFWRDASLAHSQHLANRLRLEGPVNGTATARLVNQAYHLKHVARSQKNRPANHRIEVTLSENEVYRGGLEVAEALGRTAPANATESLALLNEVFGGGAENRPHQLRSINMAGVSRAQRPASTTPPPESAPRNARRRRPTEAAVRAVVQQARDRNGKLLFTTPEAVEAEVRRRMNRTDAAKRLDYTAPNDRRGKPCGKSFTKRESKCSKPTSRRYADKPMPTNSPRGRGGRSYPAGYIPGQARRSHVVSKKTSKQVEETKDRISQIAKAAAAAGVLAGGVFAGRKAHQLYKNRRNTQVYSKYAPQAVNRAITRLSQKDVRDALNKVPEPFREQAHKLVGKAKSALAYIQADAQGYDLKKVNNDSNFSVWHNQQSDKVLTIGSVDDTLVTFSADRESTIDLRTEAGSGVGVYSIQFSSDLGFQQKTGLSKESSSKITSMIRNMNSDTMANLPKNAVLKNVPYGTDGLGDKRQAIYKRYGYKSLTGIRGNAMFATLDNGKVKRIDPQYEEFYADLLKGDDYATAAEKLRARMNRRDSISYKVRRDKKCGKSATADSNKCKKPIAQRAAEAAAIAGATGLVVVAGAAGATFLARKKSNTVRSTNPTPATAGQERVIKYPKGKTESEWFPIAHPLNADINNSYIKEADRLRRYSANLKIEPIETKAYVRSIKNIIGSTPEGALVARLAEKHKVRINSRLLDEIPKMQGMDPAQSSAFKNFTDQLEAQPLIEGAFIDPRAPGNNGIPPKNEIWVNHRKLSATEFNPNKEEVAAAIKAHLAARKKSLSTEQISSLGGAVTKQDIKTYFDSFTTYKDASADSRDFMVAIHETGHALDIGAARRNRPPIQDEAKFEQEAKKLISHYGLTDLHGAKDEFFAESFALYAMAPTTLKTEAPTVYTWVDMYLKRMEEVL